MKLLHYSLTSSYCLTRAVLTENKRKVVDLIDAIQQHILTGSIQHNPPHVAVVDCGPLDAPSNGRIDITSTTFQSMAFYSCDPGFNLVGESKRTCLASGNWSSSPPVCNGKSIVTCVHTQ